jgi:GNAT superfamily N-acetyltransferase
VYTLLELGVDANVRDPESGGTALHVAAELGWLDVVDVLVGWVPLDRQARDAAGATALGACIEGSAAAPREDRRGGGAHLVIAKVLVSNGLRPNVAMVEQASDELGAWLKERLADSTDRSELADELGETTWSADVDLLEYLSGSPVAEVRRVGDGFAFLTGLFDNRRNGVVCGRLPVETADERIVELLAWLAEHHAPAHWMVAAETDPPDLRKRLERAGCRPERTAVYMAARLTDRDLSDQRLPAGVKITSIRDAAQLAEAFAAANELDDDPEQREQELALLTSLGLGEDRPLQHYAARLHGRVVGSASAFAASARLALIDLGVAPAARRSGIGRALVLHALRKGKKAGCSLAVLSPTPATVPFYEGLEFTLGRFPPDRSFYTPLQ